MFDVEVFSKTLLGRAEIAERDGHLPARLRQALILIDGRTPLRELRERLRSLGEPEAILARLAASGFIESDYDLPPLPVIGCLPFDESVTVMRL